MDQFTQLLGVLQVVVVKLTEIADALALFGRPKAVVVAMLNDSLGLVLNGVAFTRPRKGLADHSSDARSQNLLDTGYVSPQLRSGSEAPPSFRSQTTSNLSNAPGASVTERTTLNLKNER